MSLKINELKASTLYIFILVIVFYFNVALVDAATNYYISPTGSDTNAGTSSSIPFKTFNTAIKVLKPGDTLIVLDGIYTRDTTGLATIDCKSSASNGTVGNPITIRAQNERMAYLKSDGMQTPFKITNCSYWVIEGLRTENTDNILGKDDNKGGHGFEVAHSDNIILRRILVEGNNRYSNSHGIAITSNNNILVEEVEVYKFHRHGIITWKSENITVRRSYVNSRGIDDIFGGGRVSNNRYGGDESVSAYRSSNSTFENIISDGEAWGFQVMAGITVNDNPGGWNNKILGNISLDDVYGFFVAAREVDNVIYGTGNNLIKDGLVVRPTGVGIFTRGATDTKLENMSIIVDGPHSGFVADNFPSNRCIPEHFPCTFSAKNILSLKGSAGIHAKDQDSWHVEYSNSFGNTWNNYMVDSKPTDAIYDNEGNVSNSMSVEPTEIGTGFGKCLVYIPEDSNMKGAGKGGADIGANILYKYENGILTNKPLWNVSIDNGRFSGCGAIVPGVNDIPGDSCFDVHKRLNVNTNGCLLPYAIASPPPAPTPDTTGKTDYGIFLTCFNRNATGDCAKADYNSDGFVGGPDLDLLLSSFKFDLTQDKVVNLNNTPGSDLSALKSCFFQNVVGRCLKADFNGDGTINFLDLGLLNGASSYDLNSDNIIDLRSELLCGDADGDGVVGFSDSGIVQSCAAGVLNCDPYTGDANNDGLVNTIDARLMQRVALNEFSASDLTCSAKTTAISTLSSQRASIIDAIDNLVRRLGELIDF